MVKVALHTLQVDLVINLAWKHRSLRQCVRAHTSPPSHTLLTVFFADAVLSFALIALALKVPRMKDAKSQQVAAIIWASVLFGMYSFLMSVFRVKNGGYPFWLPPF